MKKKEPVGQNGMVIYDNNFNLIPLRTLKPFEIDAFWSIMDRIKGEGDKLLIIPFDDLKRWSDWASYQKSDIEFIEHLNSLRTKMATIVINHIYDDWDDLFTVFTRFRVNQKKQVMEVELNKYFLHLFNDLIANKRFTRFLTENINRFSSSYSKEIFRRLMQFDKNKSGFWKVGIDDFKEQLQIPESYKFGNIDQRILNVVEREFLDSGLFRLFQIEKLYKAGRGRGGKVVSHLVFHFKLTGEGEVVETQPKPTVSLKELWLRDTYIPTQPNDIKNPEGLVRTLMNKYKDSTLEEMQTELSKNKPHIGKKTSQLRRIEIIPDWLFDGKSDDEKTRYINDLRLSGYTAEADKMQRHWDDSLMMEPENDEQDDFFQPSVTYEELMSKLKNQKAPS